MNEQILPEAYFDSLSIAHKLDNFLDGFERNEIHLFSYFSAILYHYAGNPVGDWKYQFIISAEGYPHSKYLDDSIERHLINGYFEEKGKFFIITGRGTDEFNKFSKSFPTYKEREKYIDAACSTSILIPYKETQKALLEDPNLKKSLKLENQDWILFDKDKLKEITKALGIPPNELIMPAVNWIKYLLMRINNING
ncbi:MAG: hypothetical protein KAT68_09970 [Bacteroidales bacterium]|nr:hypothetical protein [Bacteroidales bacterium]